MPSGSIHIIANGRISSFLSHEKEEVISDLLNGGFSHKTLKGWDESLRVGLIYGEFGGFFFFFGGMIVL